MSSQSSPVPLVSIITPSRNQGRFIRQAIESVLAQDYPAIEYLVVDGASTDTTLEVLADFGERVRWISEPDEGQGDAVDKGIQMTRGEIIGWLNSDDVYGPNAVSTAVAAFSEHPGAPAVYGDAEFIDEAGRTLGPCTQVQPFDLDRLVNELDFIVQPATFFRRSAYQSAGGLDPDLRYCLDYDLWIRLGQTAPLWYVPEVLAGVRVYPETKTASGGLARLDEIERMIRRHGRRYLPRGFQRDMLEASTRALPRAVSNLRLAAAAGAARSVLTYGLLMAGRRAIPRGVRQQVARWKQDLGRIGQPEIPAGRLLGFASSVEPAPSLNRSGAPIDSIAVVVPCHRHVRLIEPMFDSILAQTRIPDEIVLVDDASDDGTAELVRRLVASVPDPWRSKFRLLVNDRNQGQAASLNRAIGAASSRAIMVLNDDDLLMADAVEVACRLYGQHPEVALIGATSIQFGGARPPADSPTTIAAQVGPRDPDLQLRYPSDAFRYRRYNDLNMTHSGSSFLKSAWEAVGGYQVDRSRRMVPFSDRDFQLRINALYPVGVIPSVAFSLWRDDSSVDHGRNS